MIAINFFCEKIRTTILIIQVLKHVLKSAYDVFCYKHFLKECENVEKWPKNVKTKVAINER